MPRCSSLIQLRRQMSSGQSRGDSYDWTMILKVWSWNPPVIQLIFHQFAWNCASIHNSILGQRSESEVDFMSKCQWLGITWNLAAHFPWVLCCGILVALQARRAKREAEARQAQKAHWDALGERQTKKYVAPVMIQSPKFPEHIWRDLKSLNIGTSQRMSGGQETWQEEHILVFWTMSWLVTDVGSQDVAEISTAGLARLAWQSNKEMTNAHEICWMVWKAIEQSETYCLQGFMWVEKKVPFQILWFIITFHHFPSLSITFPKCHCWGFKSPMFRGVVKAMLDQFPDMKWQVSAPALNAGWLRHSWNMKQKLQSHFFQKNKILRFEL